MVKSTNIGQNFTFSESTHRYPSNDLSFTRLRRGPSFPIVFINDVIVTS